MNYGALIRLGILALPISGVLMLVGLIGRYNVPNLRLAPKDAAQATSSTGYLTIFLALMFDTFPETRWIASVMGAGGPPDADAPGTDVPTHKGEVVEPSA